jgi:hypothetical protein
LCVVELRPLVPPDFEPQRLLRCGLTGAAHRSPLRSRCCHESTPGELNHTPVPHVGHLRPYLTTGKHTSAAGGTVVRMFGFEDLFVRSKGIVVKIQIVLRAWV